MRLQSVLLALLALALTFTLATPARAEVGAADIVNAHFKAIAAEDFAGANGYFTDAFLRAFNSDGKGLNEYYTARRQQVKPGWKVLEVTSLVDEGKETAVVVVDFSDPRPDTPLLITERMYYYLMRVPVKGKAFGAAADGKAWRIDIFDALSYETLAEARRRPYLYTKDAWPEDESRELRSRQGLFRVQWALTQYFTAQGQYPAQLQGGDDKHEPLIAGGHLPGAYPINGFGKVPMRAVDFTAQSPGDFSYYAIDANEDGKHENYWLLLHGALSERNYFKGYEAIYIASGGSSQDQKTLALSFSLWWVTSRGEALEVTDATQARVASFSLIRPRIEEAPAGWWATVRGRNAGQWVYGGGRKLLPGDAVSQGELNVLTFGL